MTDAYNAMSYDDWKRQRGCSRKKYYLTRKEAEKAAFSACGRAQTLVEAYKCKEGDHWHIGKPEPIGSLRGAR